MSWSVKATLQDNKWGFSATWTEPVSGVSFLYSVADGTSISNFVGEAIYHRNVWRASNALQTRVESTLAAQFNGLDP